MERRDDVRVAAVPQVLVHDRIEDFVARREDNCTDVQFNRLILLVIVDRLRLTDFFADSATIVVQTNASRLVDGGFVRNRLRVEN